MKSKSPCSPACLCVLSVSMDTTLHARQNRPPMSLAASGCGELLSAVCPAHKLASHCLDSVILLHALLVALPTPSPGAWPALQGASTDVLHCVLQV